MAVCNIAEYDLATNAPVSVDADPLENTSFPHSNESFRLHSVSYPFFSI